MSKEDRRAKLSDLFTSISTMYNDIVTEFPEFGTVKLSQTLEEEEKYFASAQGFYKIAVVGSYSTGKTTLLKTLFYDRGLYEVDLPTAADITTQVPTIIKMIPEYTENCYVRADAITPADFMSAVRWTIDQIAQKVSIDKPDFANLSPNAFQNWVNDVAIPVLKKPTRGGTSATNEHFIKELEEAIQIFKTLEPGYKMPPINTIQGALAAIKDPKASRSLKSISISIPARNVSYPIQLVDLPGMDVPNLAHRQFSYKFIAEEADAVLFLKDSQKPSFTEGEQELLTHISSKLYDIQKKCFFIFNKWHDTDHPGAEKAVREVIENYHFQARNIFRVSALPALMYLEERDGNDVETKYRRNKQDWANNNYKELKQQYGNRLLSEMGIAPLKEFLEYYCENSLPMLAVKNHSETLLDFLKAMSKRLEEIIIDLQQGGKAPATLMDQQDDLSRHEAGLASFKECIHEIETRLDEFTDSIQQSLEKLIETTRGKVMLFEDGEFEEMPKGKIAQFFYKLRNRNEKKRKARNKSPRELDVPDGTEESVVFGDDEPEEPVDNNTPEEAVPQRPVDILTYLVKEVFPNIDIYQRARVIRNYTSGRSKVLSHEIELAVIKDVNKLLREKFLEVLVTIIAHHIAALCRTIDNEGYIDRIEDILNQFKLSLFMQPHTMFAKFMDELKTNMNEACKVMAEMAIKKLDEVGVYNEDLTRVAALPCETQNECRKKQEVFVEYLTENYKKHIAIAFQTLLDEGWDELSEKIAKGREQLVGLLGRHDVIAAKIFEERKAMERRGQQYKRALFEEIENALKEKMAVFKEAASVDLEVKVTQRNAKITEQQQKIQMFMQQCKELIGASDNVQI